MVDVYDRNACWKERELTSPHNKEPEGELVDWFALNTNCDG